MREARLREHRCKAKTKAGNPCRAAATAGGFCFFHANPNKASELGRVGGRKRRILASESSESVPIPNSVKELRDLTAQLIRDVYAGRLHPRVATGLAALLNLQVRVLELKRLEEFTVLQQRVQQLEKLVSATKGGLANP
jgi:hypothetical protein